MTKPRTPFPPPWADNFLKWYCHDDLLDEIQGDLHEQFQKNYQSKGANTAKWKFILDVFRFCRPSSFKKTIFSMNTQIISNYIKVAFRVFKKEKGYTFTNVSGLALGITCSLFIYLWVLDELKYNQWPDQLDKIHYVFTNSEESNGTIRTWGTTPQPLKKILMENYPSIEKAAVMNWGGTYIFKKGEENIPINGIEASPELFEIFSIPFIQGNHEIMYDQPNTIAISERAAEKYFGEGWRTIHLPGQILSDKNKETFTISGVFKNIPKQSTLDFDFVIPYEHYLATRDWLTHWGNFANRTFVQIGKEYSTRSANENVKKAIIDHRPDNEGNSELMLQPFADLYLFNKKENGKVAGGRVVYIKLLSISAILILVLAGVNFMNLTTAKSAKRSKEAGVRKVLGAFRSSLRLQFIIESILITYFAVLISIILVAMLLPQFNLLVGKEITIDYFSLQLVLLILGFTMLLGILSGLYPAFYMASLNPISSMKGIIMGDRFNTAFRRGLIVFQFIITIVMITGSITIYKQLNYIFTKNLGLDRDNVIKVPLGDISMESDYATYKERLLQSPGIQSITVINQSPIDINNSTHDPEWDGKKEGQNNSFYILETDPDFVPTMNINILEGRNFDWKLSTDTAHYLVNQTAAKLMGLDQPIGVGLEFWERKGRIIGLVEDFHMKSLHEPIEPLIIRQEPGNCRMAMVKTAEGQTKKAIASLETLHKEYNPDRVFDFEFLDDNYTQRYKSEILVGKFTFYFTLVAIIISALGLLSLISFSTELKTKEIGIRKVLGASVSSILRLIGKEFIILVAFAFFIATPVAYLIIQNWLKEFEFHIDLSVWLFILSGLAALGITLLTIANQAIRSALRNPVDSLRNE